MITLAYCDDNDLQRDMLATLLEDYTASRHVSLRTEGFAGGEALLEAVRRHGFFSIYILDMIMPGYNGLEVASALRALHDEGKIIFLTSSLDYALASYDVEAFYYMLKPVQREKLFHVLDKAIRTFEEEHSDAITLSPREGGEVTISMRSIAYVTLKDRLLQYHLKDGRVITTRAIRTSFREAVAPLLNPRGFALCGVSNCVNLAEIDALDSDSVLLRNGDLMYYPKSAYNDIKDAWRAYRKG